MLAQLALVKPLEKRWPGEKVFLDTEYGANPEKAQFMQNFAAIAKRFGIDPPDVIIVKPDVDKSEKPKPQKPDASIGWAVIDGKFHDIVFVSKNIKNGLNDKELLAVVAHEMGHVVQVNATRHNPHLSGKTVESDADKSALSCPEVDPTAFKSMLVTIEQLIDEVAKKHPLLYGDFTGSMAIIPASVQTKMAFGGNHPMTSTRIKLADEELQRRNANHDTVEAPQQAAPQVQSVTVQVVEKGDCRNLEESSL